VSSLYSLDIGSLLTFHPEGAFSKLMPYFFGGYREVWVVFILTTVLALLHDWRRFLPFWLVSLGMVVAVFVLYLGQWSAVESESGAGTSFRGRMAGSCSPLVRSGSQSRRQSAAGPRAASPRAVDGWA
jgi:hypothetical protein